jgi:glucose/arabinose dehydrogenase
MAILGSTGRMTLLEASDDTGLEMHSGSAKIALKQIFDRQRFREPVTLLQVPGSNSRWYIAEKAGRVLLLDTKTAPARISTLLDITETVDSGPSEAGLLGIAFHPDFPANGQLFLSYTQKGSFFGPKLISHISRLSILNGAGAQKNKMETLLTLAQPYANHNGGNIAFGPDGYLYIGFGDGGSGGDPQGNAQNTGTLLGTILRIDVNGPKPYKIPPDNPLTAAKSRSEIYAWGLRNPWRFSFDRLNGELWAADVGQSAWEEINRIEKGKNYGWNIKEGSACYGSSECKESGLTDPVAAYGHDLGCSVTGGYVYRGKKIKALQGVYLFGDFCSGKVWGIPSNADKPVKPTLLLESRLSISSFAQDNDGELYLLDYGEGGIYKIVAADKN